MPVQQLNANHDIKSFRCGNPRVVDFLFNEAPNSTVYQTSVVVQAETMDQWPIPITGFYCISYSISQIVDEEGRPFADVFTLGWMGVARSYQRRPEQYGTQILLKAIEDAAKKQSFNPTVRFLHVPAINKDTKQWFLDRDLGFWESFAVDWNLDSVLRFADVEEAYRQITERQIK